MDHHIEISFLIPVNLNKMVAAAQRPQAQYRLFPAHMLKTAKLLQFKGLRPVMGLLPYLKPDGILSRITLSSF